MRRFIILSLVGLVGVVGLFGIGGAAGYYSHKLELDPVHSLAERAEAKFRRELGLPSATVGTVKKIETIFLDLEGKVYTMPGQDFQGGGALTVWDGDVLAMHMSGRIFHLDAEDKLVRANINLPDNGRSGYAALGEGKYAGRPIRIDALRYNDIEFIESEEHRGLALSYTYVDAESECYRSRISWVDVPTGSVRNADIKSEDWRVLFETSPCLPFNETGELMVAYMAGGRMVFESPGTLYLGSGEYHLDGIYRPDVGIQDGSNDYGKTIAIDLATGNSRHVSVGHRNLQGIVLDKQGRLWTTEHGMRGGDELNLIRNGWNYGWPDEDMGTLYNGIANPNPTGPGRHETFPAPVFAWVPSAAVSSLAIVDGFHPAWDGDLLIGSLKGRTVFRARIMGTRLVSLEPIEIGQRVRDVMQIAPDEIALWLDSNELVILRPLERSDPLKDLVAGLTANGMTPDLADSVHGVLTGCNECHSYKGGIVGAGPSLFNIVGANIASTAFDGYSEALLSAPGVWDAERLAAYLDDPAAHVPGTYMASYGLGDRELAAAVVEGLSWLWEAEAAIAEAVR